MSKPSYDEDRKRMLASFDIAFGELGFKRKKITYRKAFGKETWILYIEQHQGFRPYLTIFFPDLFKRLPWVGDRDVSKDGPGIFDGPFRASLRMLAPGGGDGIFQWDRPSAEQEVIDLVRTYAMPWFEKYSDPLECSRSIYATDKADRKMFTDLAEQRANESEDTRHPPPRT